MKKLLPLFLLCVSVFVFSFSIGQTLAYWIAEDKTDNLITTGQLTAKIVEEYEQNQIVYPGDVIPKAVNVANTGNVDSIIRVKVTKAWGQVRENGQLIIDSTLSTENIVIDYNTDSWFYDANDGYFYYKGVLEPGRTTAEPLFTEFHITNSTDNDFANMHADIGVKMESVQAAYGAVSIWGKTLDNLGVSYVPSQTQPDGVPSVMFVSPDKKFTFVSENGDVFCAWEHLIPGESRSQVISVQNNYTQKVPISIKAVYNGTAGSPDEKELIDDLLKKYVTITITDAFGKTVYNGPIWGNLDAQDGTVSKSMKNYIGLGEFAVHQAKNYNITVQVSPEMDNRYGNLSGKITWMFQAAGDSESEYPDLPPTGDAFNLILYLSLMAASGFTIIFLTVSRRKATQ